MAPARYFFDSDFSFARSSLTSAARRELRLACAKAGNTATWAMCPRPTTAYLTNPPLRLDIGHLVPCSAATTSQATCRRNRSREDPLERRRPLNSHEGSLRA